LRVVEREDWRSRGGRDPEVVLVVRLMPRRRFWRKIVCSSYSAGGGAVAYSPAAMPRAVASGSAWALRRCGWSASFALLN
jgi:hypothetical protein